MTQQQPKLITSPVILRLKVADRDESSPTTDCELVLQWRPLDKGGGTVDPEDDQRGLPYPLLLGPHIGITVRSTCHYTVTFGSPVNTYNTKRQMTTKTNYVLLQQLVIYYLFIYWTVGWKTNKQKKQAMWMHLYVLKRNVSPLCVMYR